MNWIKLILVDDVLHPIREAAAKGEIIAMTRLATHLSEARNTPFQLRHFERLIHQIEMHSQLGDNPFVTMEFCKTKADLNVYLYNEGELSESESLNLQRHAYQEYFKVATDLPKDLWDFREMKLILDWLYNDNLVREKLTN